MGIAEGVAVVMAAAGRGGDDIVATLAQNGNGLRADQAGAADDDDLHGLPSLVDDWRPLNANTSEKKSGLNARASCKHVRMSRDLFPPECSGSEVSVLGYSTTSSRCGAVFLRRSNIGCRCLSWVIKGP